MKLVISMLFFLLFCCCLFSQSRFHKQYSYGSNNLFKVENSSDSSFVVITRHLSKIRVIKYDKLGNHIWSKSYNTTGSSTPYNINPTSDHGYIVTGVEESSNGFVFKIDSSGVVQWSKVLGPSGSCFAQSAMETSSGDYFALSTVYAYPVPGIQLTKFNSNGNIIWSKLYETSILLHSPKVVEISSSRYLIVTQDKHPSDYSFDIKLIMIDASGSVIWSKLYGESGNEELSDVIVDTNKNIFISGSTNSFSGGFSDAFLWCIDSTGNPQWARSYGSESLESSRDFDISESGDFYISGDFSDTTYGQTKGFLVKIDSSRNLQWVGKVGNKQGSALGVKVTADDNLVVSGYSKVFGSYKSFLRKSNSSGFSGCGSDFLQWQQSSNLLRITSINQASQTKNDTIVKTVNTIGLTGSIYNNCINYCDLNAAFTYDNNIICLGDSVHFSSAPNDSLSIKWFVDGVLEDSLNDFGRRFNTPGQFEVRMVISDSTCSDTALTTIFVDSNSVSSFDYAAQLLVVDFAPSKPNMKTYYWDFGDGSNSYQRSPRHVFEDVGNYTVCLTTTTKCDTTTLCKQISLVDTVESNFQRIYNPSTNAYHQWINDVTTTSDGGYAMTGTDTYYGSSDWDIYLSKVNSKGEPLWSKAIGSSGSDQAFAITECHDLGFILGGKTSTNGNASIIKTDSKGKVLWRKIITSTSGSPKINDIIQTQNLDYVAIGKINNKLLAMRLDVKGKLVWAYNYDEGAVGNALLEADNGDIFLVGRTTNDIYVAKIQSDGKIIWSKTYGGPNYDHGLSIAEASSTGEYYISGIIDGDALAMRILDNGVLLSAKYYRTSFNSYEQGTGIVTNRAGSTFLSVKYTNGGDAALLKLNSNDQVLWSYAYTPGFNNFFHNGIELTYDDGVVWPGWSTVDGSSDDLPSLVKVDKDGNIDCNRSSVSFLTGPVSLTSTNLNADTVISISGIPPFSLMPSHSIPLEDSLECYHDNYCSPIAMFSYSIMDTTVTFSDSSALAEQWIWAFGDGDSSNQQSPQHTYKGKGPYWACLTTTNLCGSHTYCDSIHINCPPVDARFSSQDSLGEVTFIDSTENALKWLWDFGDGQYDSVQNPIHQYSKSGIYQVRLVASNTCSTDTFYDSVTVFCPLPQSGFNHTDTLLSAYFQDNSTGANSWSWSFGDGDTSNSQNPIHNYPLAGNYYVCLTTSNPCGTNSFCDSITIECPIPTAGFTYQDSLLTINFLDTSKNAQNLIWYYGNGDSSIATDPVYTYASEGVYIVCLKAINGCGSDLSCDTLNLKTSGTANLSRNLKFHVYPNPFKLEATVEFDKGLFQHPLEIRMYDLKGREFKTFRNITENRFVISKDILPPGTYFLVVIDSNGALGIEKLQIK